MFIIQSILPHDHSSLFIILFYLPSIFIILMCPPPLPSLIMNCFWQPPLPVVRRCLSVFMLGPPPLLPILAIIGWCQTLRIKTCFQTGALTVDAFWSSGCPSLSVDDLIEGASRLFLEKRIYNMMNWRVTTAQLGTNRISLLN